MAENHEYEEGDVTIPMHTDPMCAVCGRPKMDRIHAVVRVGIPRGTDGSQ